MVHMPPGKFLRALEFISPFSKDLESSGNQCRFWNFDVKVVEDLDFALFKI